MPKLPLSPALGELGARIRERRLELGLSQEGLADRTELHWSYLGQIERGQRNLTIHNVLRIAAALGLDAGELVRGLSYDGRAHVER